MIITSCKINHITNPLGFCLNVPHASWKIENSEGKTQKSARILVARDPQMSDIVYDTTDTCLSNLSTALEFPLHPYTRYYWTVTVTADNDDTAVSEINWFETAKMTERWDADWITTGAAETENPIFTKTFNAKECEARLYICGLGLYTAYLNGERIGNEYLAPYCNDYHMWLQYQTYILPLKEGDNTLSIFLGNGWYKGRFGLGGEMSNYGDSFQLIAEIRRKEQLLLKTDTSWTYHSGPIGLNGIYDGEIYDSTRLSTSPSPVVFSSIDKQLLHERLSLPVIVKQELKPTAVITTPAGETVLDMGQNMVGILRFTVDEPKGTKIHLQFGEILQHGNFYRDNLRDAKAEYIYISDGQKRIVEQHFTYYGFRYVKVMGIHHVCAEDFTGCVLYSDLDSTGTLTTSNSKINQLIHNCIWSHKGNYLDVPTDCPQRDERLGWTGDTQVFAATACFSMDSYAFLNKQLYDTWMTQQELGFIPNFIPAFQADEPTSCAWGDMATIVPWTLYQFYGDKTILAQQFKSMKAWAEYMYEQDQKSGGHRLWITNSGFGDWLAMDHDNPKERFCGGTDLTFLHSAYYYYSTTLVSKAAAVLGYQTDQQVYSTRAKEIRNAFLEEFYTPTGRLAINTQTGYALALYTGLYPEGSGQILADCLAQKIKDGGGYLKTGFIGTPILCRILSVWGHSDTAYRLLFNEGTPSWLYAVNLGATTIWERWNSVLPDGTVNGTDMNSLNHYAYGAILEWMYRHMIGLQPDENAPGFKHVIIAPELNVQLSYASATYDSPAGIYEISWAVTGNSHVELNITVPFDANATVKLPGKSETINIEAGAHQWSYETDSPLWEVVDTYSCFNDLREYPPAEPLLDKYMPGWKDIPSIFCNESLRNMAKSPFISITEEAMDTIDAQLH